MRSSSTHLFIHPRKLTGKWWTKALHNDGARNALTMSLKTAVGATIIALVFGLLFKIIK